MKSAHEAEKAPLSRSSPRQAEGDSAHYEETTSDKIGRFSFVDLPLRGTTRITLCLLNNRMRRRWFNVGFELDPQNEIQKPPVYRPTLPEQSFGVRALLETFQMRKLLEQAFLDSLKHIPGMIYIEEVAITAKPYIKNSHNRNGPGNADYVLDEKDLRKFDRFSNLMEVLEHELGAYTGLEISFDGRPLPYYGEPPSTSQGWLDYHEYYANLKRSLAVSELVGVEVMISPEYTRAYGDKKIIEVTTKNGDGIVRGHANGMVTIYLHGYSTPRQFYLPKYLPKEFPDRLTYHRQPTLLWVPELITSEEGKAEVSLPVGRNFARTLRVRIESYSPTGVVGSDEVYLPVGREKGTW